MINKSSLNLNAFTGKYSLSKTLRFKLLPIGNTLSNIISSGILEEDQHRAESYIKVKAIIDEYHKAYISLMLHDFKLKYEDTGNLNSLEEYFYYYHLGSKDEKEQKCFEKIQQSLRKQIADRLTKDERFKRIDKKELFKKDLIEFVQGDADSDRKVSLISEFQNFTVYFTGFHENRKNMYSADEKSTAIAYRLIHENLPRFIDNMQVFASIASTEIAEKFSELYKNFEEYLQVIKIDDLFQLDYFTMVLTQKHIDVYNAIIGGKTTENGEKIQGLNEYINLYNQHHKDKKLPKFKTLFKQILSDREAISWLPDAYKNDREVILAINEFYATLQRTVLGSGALRILLENISNYDLSGVYVRNDQQLTEISQRMYGHWSVIQNAIKKELENTLPQKKKESYEDYQTRIDKLYKSKSSFSISFINQCLQNIASAGIEEYFKTLGAVQNETTQMENHFARITNAYTDAEEILHKDWNTERKLLQDAEATQKIKQLLDTIKGLQLFIKPMLGSGDEANKDERFYGELAEFWNELDLLTPLYNKVRNYVTQKPYSEEKIKLNFKNPTLLKGWELNKETDYTSVILRRNGLYYLAIMNKKHNKVFSSYPSGDEADSYEKMEYKQLPNPYMNLPRVFISSESGSAIFKPSKEIQERYQRGTHAKGDNFNLEDCHALIDFFKQSLNKHEDWKQFNFHFSETSSYSDISKFYREVSDQGYKLTFSKISSEYIDQLVEEGKIYLFQIYNKDFSSYSKGTPNMHTLYWKMLFDEKNLSDVVYKLNGEAEVFFRKSSIKSIHPTHPANQPVKNKNILNEKKESVFTYDLIKDKRYSVDQFQFHVPITMNFKATGSGNINSEVNTYLRNTDDLHVIGIDRGERHLLYLVVTDMQGRICEQFSLNEIITDYNGRKYATNYHELLQRKEDERLKARQSWQSIENIKELKEGYLSQVVHKISELMVKYNAIVVLEDLNSGFMRGRQKVEKQVYQKFEKMLIDKLNYLVFKKNQADQPGGVLHAYQLTNKFESFAKLGKQCGFLYYIPAWNTSKMDPTTGFVNLFDVHYESVDKAKAFFSKFTSIRYNAQQDWFEFSFDYSDFTKKAEGTRSQWTLCSYGTRVKTFRNEAKNSRWDSKEIVLTEEFKKLFDEAGIDIHANIKEELANTVGKEFFVSFIELFKLMLQIRNSVTGTETDYLISPVRNKQGAFYDSRTANEQLPQNADANGAYNIARKGLMLIERIRNAEESSKADLKITNKDWLIYAQEFDK